MKGGADMAKFKDTISANGNEIAIISDGIDNDYISLTDIARYKSAEPKDVIKNWMRSKSTIEFLGLWEKLNNPNFKGVEFDSFKNEAGANAFTMSPQKWIESTDAIGVISKSGRNGGTFAHKDIAFEFASWVSAEFKLYIIKDYQRLKADESNRLSLDWNVKRTLAKINYKIHTDAIKENIIPKCVTEQQKKYSYASEADILNVALFGMTATEWKKSNSELKGNIRDYATVQQLVVLTNLESLNAEYIRQCLSPNERLMKLNEAAINQMKSLSGNFSVNRLESK